MSSPQQQAEPDSAAWISHDENEGAAVDKVKPAVLGRNEAADWLRKQAAVASPRRKARKLRQRADRMASTGTTQPPRKRVMPQLREIASRIRPYSDRRPRGRSVRRPREQGRGRSHARRGPPSDDPEPPFAAAGPSHPAAVTDLQRDILGRLYFIAEALEEGDAGMAHAIALDAIDDLRGAA